MIDPNFGKIRIVDVGFGHGLASSNVIAPTLINAYSAMTIPAYWRAISFIADNLASLPLYIATEDDDGEVKDHPLDDLLELTPNAYQNRIVFFRTLYYHAAHAGRGFARVQRDKSGNTLALHGLFPDDVMPFRATMEGEDYPEQFYAVRSLGKVIASADMVHLQGLSWDGMTAIDPVAAHQSTLQRAATIDRYQTRFLTNGTMVKCSVELPVGMTPEQLLDFKAFIRSNFTGPEAEDDTLLLPNGAKLNNNTVSPEDSQLIEQATYTTKQIAQITNVPPEFLYERSESKYTGIAEAGENVVRYTLRPWIEQIEAEFTLKLITPADRAKGLRVKMDPDALLRGDVKSQTETAVSKVRAGIWTINNALRYLGEPKSTDPEADKHKSSGDTTPQTPAPAPAKPA